MSAPDALVSGYLQWLTVEKGRSRATIEAYQRDIQAFLTWWGSARPLSEVTSADLESYLNQLRATRAASSLARILSSLRGWWGFLLDEGVLDADPSEHVTPSRRGRTLPKPLPEEVLSHLLDSMPSETPVDRRDRALLELLYGTGARVSEVVGLELQDLDFDEELIRVTGKGSKQRLVPMGQTLKKALSEYLSPGGRSEFPKPRSHANVFVNSRGGSLSRQGIDLIISSRALIAGVNRSTISAHVFRHSCATHMLAHGADIRVVQELLGHASIATTQVYTAVSITSMQSVYSNAHPRAHD
ncbi:MAG: tyrosine recombinase [Acidimicrobiaceae bacterium]|nr:tyrosine recombinase [Acidimicrobiaceae bacterium]